MKNSAFITLFIIKGAYCFITVYQNENPSTLSTRLTILLM